VKVIINKIKGVKMPALSNKISDAFLEWLNNCPYMWHLDSSSDNHLSYTFIIENPTKEELE
jgi:hypothetical protein